MNARELGRATAAFLDKHIEPDTVLDRIMERVAAALETYDQFSAGWDDHFIEYPEGVRESSSYYGSEQRNNW